MLFLTCGLPKSASTFSHQLARDIAWSNGHDQRALAAALPPPSTGTEYLDLEKAACTDPRAVAEAIAHDQVLVLKTHSGMSDEIKRLLDEGLVRASVTFRDPRDAAVAVLETAERDRRRSESRGFHTVFTMRDAIDLVAPLLSYVGSWLSDTRILRIPFDLIVTNPTTVVTRLAAHMGLQVNPAEILEPYHSGEKMVGEFNRGVAGRHRGLLTEADLAYAHERFGSYIEYFDELTQAAISSESVGAVAGGSQ